MAHFFGSGRELRDLLVPYFKAGLENNERCLWVTGRAFDAEEARSSLRMAVPDFDKRERDKQIEIANSDEWYGARDKLRPHDLVAGLVQREREAIDLGYTGLRTNGNCSWVSADQWSDFLEYERLVHEIAPGRRMICMCSYCTEELGDGAHLEVMDRHHLAVPTADRRPGEERRRILFEPHEPIRDEVDGIDFRQALERQRKIFDLAMLASDMGTWRYTFADNVCVYDRNAQRLYGLTEPLFLHNEDGVKEKFHPDDQDLMWSRVAAALDPKGDGRYEVEYRVKQLDGSWRWLSAWGLVEFDGAGSNRTPVAIVGASRDLTQQKQAEELQRLLLNELNHRVKNTFATIQAIAAQTLRASRDLPSAKEALNSRIRSLAHAHDLLTTRAWTGADLADIVTRTLDAFAPSQIRITGAPIDVPAKHALALSLILHELATNAAKYGALSRPEGSVSIQWKAESGSLRLDWKESGGPPVEPPTTRGFGSRLLEDLVNRDLNGGTELVYDISGVRCTITATL